MPSPVGHTLAGLITYSFFPKEQLDRQANLRVLAAVFCAANLPDIDTVFGLLPDSIPGADSFAHRGPLHSLGAAVFFTLAVYLFTRVRHVKSPARWAALLGCAYASHIFLDYLNADFGPPLGVPMFWPLTHAYYISPVTIFLNIEWKHPSMWISMHHLIAVGIEIAILAPVLWIRRAWGAFRGSRMSARVFEP
jgi:membrane-bound metal-dependent hydrolase YbcI (DUF457 family)